MQSTFNLIQLTEHALNPGISVVSKGFEYQWNSGCFDWKKTSIGPVAPHILQLRGKSCPCMKGAVKERFHLFVCSSLFPCILQSLLVIFSVMSHSVCVIMRRGTHSQLQLLSALPCLTHFESSGIRVKGFSKLKKKRAFLIAAIFMTSSPQQQLISDGRHLWLMTQC